MKKKTSDDLYKEITTYTPTDSEIQREAERQKEISKMYARIAELEAKGNKLLYGVSAGDAVTGNFRNKEEVTEIAKERRQLINRLREYRRMPIQDDEYMSICDELEEATAARIESEAHYTKALTEYSAAKGKIPFETFKGLEKECYTLSQQTEELRNKEQMLLEQKANYDRKTDVLYSKYTALKDAEIKAHVLEMVDQLRKYITAAREEKQNAEVITLSRKGMTPKDIELPIPFGGDNLRQLLTYCDEIERVTERL